MVLGVPILKHFRVRCLVKRAPNFEFQFEALPEYYLGKDLCL